MLSTSFPADSSFEYEVVGEHRIDPLHLLTVDRDGRLFDLNLKTGGVSPTELTDQWRVDTVLVRWPGNDDQLISPSVLVVG